MMQSVRQLLMAGGVVMSLGCSGIITPPPGDTEAGEAPRFPRLTNEQWRKTVADLLYLDEPLVLDASLQADPPLGRFDNNIDRLTFSSGHWRSFQRAAEEVAAYVAQTPSIVSAISGEVPSDEAQQGRAFVEVIGPRAYRRPLSEAEIVKYSELFREGATHYPDAPTYEAGVRIVLEAMLQSPYFLYRVEDSEQEVAGAVRLDGYEVASRLSYAFWNTMPSDELFAAAEAGDLDGESGVREWATTMFEDERTMDQFRSFHVQAFEMSGYSDLDKSAELFPEWERDVGSAMLTESARFLEGEVFGGGGIRELLTSNRTYVNAELASIYGIEGDFGEEFVPVDLDPEQRSGMLTRLGFLTKNATLTQSDPIHRGVFVNLNLLCRPISAPPEIPDDLNFVGETNRERINSVTGPGTCGAGCHANLINPIGFALEHYDAVGAYRTEESGHPVDASDVYIFASGEELHFDNALDLSAQLAESPEAHACYIQHLFEYLLGRTLGPEDMKLVAAYADESLATGLSIREIILRVVESRAFRFRAKKGGSND